MKCPNCNVIMTLKEQSDLGYSCKDTCGFWLQKKNKWNFISYDFEKTKAKTQKYKKCPECSSYLKKIEVRLADNDIQMQPDVCINCQGVFINIIDFKSLQKSQEKIAPVSNLSKLKFFLRREETSNDLYYRKNSQDRDFEIQHYAFSLFIGLPIEINLPPQKVPIITFMFLAINLFLFFELSETTIMSFALIPSKLKMMTFLSSIFLHGSWIHLLGNMYFLYILGDNVEDRLGKCKYILFYFLCGIVANITYFSINKGSSMPVVGASGAISGVMGAYLLACHKAKFGVMIFFFMVKIPAVTYFAFWIMIQFILSTMNTNVAWEAHLGGFFAGLVLYPILKNISQRK